MTGERINDEARPELGKFLKDIRESRRMTLRDVERVTDGKVSNGYLSQLENGGIGKPSAVMLHRLSAVYAIDYGTLMERAGFVSEAEVPSNRAATSVLGDLTPQEEQELLNYLTYMRSKNK
ncbi:MULTISPECIES: helix-turn-helix domain-containing protein [unclassified Bradyrhizobium]|uniref:helix-turn-helix domain-containing protein n=1 Tax=Bradyrhizobium sp. USDA 4541 TaxID=2817704 RepID=UPI0020A4030A|nr:helix-turn-helix domain-containing protein [Bradyrhizobium sp. USDA 4541]MCP1848114.1 transcriptional regulator with XRE-family HTH domain [Bradyrhizobium sp. USDA 4541]